MIEYTARITSQDTPRVGGRNLILNSDRTIEINVGDRQWDFLPHSPSINLNDLNGTPVTVSFWAKSTGGNQRLYISLASGNFSKIYLTKPKSVIIPKEWAYFSFSVAEKSDTELNRVIYATGCTGGATDGMVWLKNVKLERGTVATDWTPAPEDVEESVSNVNTSLVSLASTLLDHNEGDIPQLFRQQDQLANSVKDKADKLELANSVSSLQGEIYKRALGLHLDNAFAYIENIVKEIDSSRSYTISDSGYISSSVHNSCRYVSKEVTPSSTVCRTPNTQPQIRLTLRSDHDALKRQVNSLTAQLAQLQATTKITPVLNTDTRKRSGSTTLYPQYGDWLLTSDSQEQYISFSGLSAEIGRSIYIQTRRKAYLYANNQSFYGLPGTSSSVAVNQWLANNTTYRFLRADATTWLVTASSSPYPWT